MGNQSWMLHHDNAQAHESPLSCSFLAKQHIPVAPQSARSQVLVPAHFLQSEKHVKRTLFSNYRGDTVEQCDEQPARGPTKCVLREVGCIVSRVSYFEEIVIN